MTTQIDGIEDLKSRIGEQIGFSEWHTITPAQVQLFADATGDHQWIHLDEEKAKAGPFGMTIAHGYLTLSLAPMLMSEAFVIGGDVKMGVNYGANKLRFTAPVPVGSRVRMGATLQAVEDFSGGAQYIVELIFEIEGSERPACVAECIYRVYT
ncbi:MAG: acyl dehydratase [Candidatus Poriferisodalaceae bacterium]|jgi:acyl dehydratase|tara:strand:- start:3708 stop:4166 length:459 start_codon:yes stop_codon:yes gene_type:complete